MKNAVEYDFILDGGRTNHQLILINNTDKPVQLKKIKITTNALITEPWQSLGQYWNSKNLKQSMNSDNTKYVYELTLPQPLTLAANSRNPVLEYSVKANSALGPIKDVIMPPDSVDASVNDQGTQNVTISGKSNDADPHPGKQLNYYDANWGQYAFQRTVDNQNFKDLNRVTYAFIGFNESGQVTSLDPWGDQLELPKLALAKKRNPYLKMNLGFGGWTNAGRRMDTVFSDMAKNDSTRALFVKNAVDAVVQAGADGIDIDWEFPNRADAANFVKLITELRAALKKRVPNAKLTIAAPAGKDNIEALSKEQWQTIAANLDAISIMTYDYFGSFSDSNDFHSAWELDPNSSHVNQQGEASYFCITKTLQLFEQMGIDKKKLVLGIPNYSRGAIVNDLGQFSGLYQPIVGSPAGENAGDGGMYSWDAILKLLRNQPSALDQLGVKKWNYYGPDHPLCQKSQMSLLMGQLPDNRYVVINFLEPNSAYKRAKFVADNGYGGAMVWANYFEPLQYEDSFMNALSCGLENKPYNFTPKLDAKTHLEAAKHHNSKRKSNLKQMITNQVQELQDAETRNSIIYKVLSFIGNLLPVKLIFAPIKAFILGVAEKMLNVDVEAKTNKKIQALKDIAEAHTSKKAQDIIDENLDALNQHRNPIKRLLVAILPKNFVMNSKSLRTESLKLAQKYEESLPIIGDSNNGVLDSMEEVHPPVEPDMIITSMSPPPPYYLQNPSQMPVPQQQFLYPVVNQQTLLPTYPQAVPMPMIQNGWNNSDQTSNPSNAMMQSLPYNNPMELASAPPNMYVGNPYMNSMFQPSAPVDNIQRNVQTNYPVYPYPNLAPVVNSQQAHFPMPSQVVMPQSFFAANARLNETDSTNNRPFKTHGEGPHHTEMRRK